VAPFEKGRATVTIAAGKQQVLRFAQDDNVFLVRMTTKLSRYQKILPDAHSASLRLEWIYGARAQFRPLC
jgi:hypothetical protein